MLELRPNCEYCDKDLPVNAPDARICSYECTFCADCVSKKLSNVCPNCGGGFVPRPIRPAVAHRENTSRQHQRPSTIRQYLSYPIDNINALVLRLKHIAPEDR